MTDTQDVIHPMALEPTHRDVERALRDQRDPEKAASYPKFFRTEPGSYGEGDRFIGVTVPKQRAIAKSFRDLSLPEIEQLLASEWHECRLTALLILVLRFERSDDNAQAAIVDFYLRHTDRVNQWDLVDSSAPKILGRYLLERPEKRALITKLAGSSSLWEQRIAILATYPSIRAGQLEPTLGVAQKLLHHRHDLIHKAIGWMLREVGKQDLAVLRSFLSQHAATMPRTMLRYAIEKLSPDERQRWLAAKGSAT